MVLMRGPMRSVSKLLMRRTWIIPYELEAIYERCLHHLQVIVAEPCWTVWMDIEENSP
jgi:hypothetical protein